MTAWKTSTARTQHPGQALLPPSGWLYLRTALRLSDRELQIVQRVFDDQKEDLIAAELGISPHTVRTYFQRLYAKLSVASRAQLVVRVMAAYLAAAQPPEPFPPSLPHATAAAAWRPRTCPPAPAARRGPGPPRA
jgi:DNA-binding CsgD family transcriptional regulator